MRMTPWAHVWIVLPDVARSRSGQLLCSLADQAHSFLAQSKLDSLVEACPVIYIKLNLRARWEAMLLDAACCMACTPAGKATPAIRFVQKAVSWHCTGYRGLRCSERPKSWVCYGTVKGPNHASCCPSPQLGTCFSRRQSSTHMTKTRHPIFIVVHKCGGSSL